MNEIAIVTDQKEIEKIFLSDSLTKQIKAIKKDALCFVADINTGVGRKAYASKAREIASQKVVIDNAGKDLKSQYKVKCDQIDAVRKRARETLDQVKFDVRKPLTEWEMEENRKEQEKRDVVEFEMMQEEGIAENELFDREKEIERREAELQAQEEAKLEKERTEQAEKERIEREARIATEARERAEQEAQEAIEAEKRATIEAELRAKQDAELAEREKKEAAEKAELEKQEAIDRAKREEIERQERERLAQEEEAHIKRVAEEKKAANVAHQRKINKEAVNCFVDNKIPAEAAKNIIALIAHEKIKHIFIKY